MPGDFGVRPELTISGAVAGLQKKPERKVRKDYDIGVNVGETAVDGPDQMFYE